MTWWIWVLIGFALLAIEFASTTLHVAFFGLGALFVALLVGLGWHGPLWAQFLVFTAFSLVALLLIRPPLMRKLKLNESKDVDTLVGEHAVAMDDIAIQGFGKAEMRGSSWNAQNVGTGPLKKGQRCTVESVEGLVIRVRA
jgi:membrane protein implicated in regulation of membrane protease activity